MKNNSTTQDFDDYELEDEYDLSQMQVMTTSSVFDSRRTSMSVQEIEVAITKLPPQKITDLLNWLEEYHAQLWDEQIEQDLERGSLDALLAEVDAEYEAGLAQPL